MVVLWWVGIGQSQFSLFLSSYQFASTSFWSGCQSWSLDLEEQRQNYLCIIHQQRLPLPLCPPKQTFKTHCPEEVSMLIINQSYMLPEVFHSFISMRELMWSLNQHRVLQRLFCSKALVHMTLGITKNCDVCGNLGEECCKCRLLIVLRKMIQDMRETIGGARAHSIMEGQ